GVRRQASDPGDDAELFTSPDTVWSSNTSSQSLARTNRIRPFKGLRVLDLGIIVAGGEAGRLFADLGADVIKVESSKHPDGSRAVMKSDMTSRFASGHRNKRSFGVDLRSERGKEIFRSLVEVSDVLLSNFKPRTL